MTDDRLNTVLALIDVDHRDWARRIWGNERVTDVIDDMSKRYFTLRPGKMTTDRRAYLDLAFALAVTAPFDWSFAWNLAGDLSDFGLHEQAQGWHSRAGAMADIKTTNADENHIDLPVDTYPDADPARFHSAAALMRLGYPFAALCEAAAIVDVEWRSDVLDELTSTTELS